MTGKDISSILFDKISGPKEWRKDTEVFRRQNPIKDYFMLSAKVVLVGGEEGSLESV